MTGRREHALRLSRNIGDRILLGCLALPISVISGLGVWVVTTRTHGSGGVVESLWSLVIDEAVITVFRLIVLSVLWAVAAPRWLESLLRRSAIKAVFATLVFLAILLWMFEFTQGR